uniref:RING-H2 finger protein ATL43 n=1 Tax=Erigeron canadensis TaxID=72917 RepID=UPI001CB98B43|nr:RING-H2 finger protein ATL43 [Erigeron canadensis]
MTDKPNSNFQWNYHPTPLLLLFLISTTTSSPTPPPPQPLPELPSSPPHISTLKPSMTILIGIITTIFSITFLLLLYTKHCRRNSNSSSYPRHTVSVHLTDRINSGIDRTIIESLPVFRFGSLTGQKDGLECAVCLSRFNRNEMLRLLPKCKHAFHVECVDTWLDQHSTCPLCRYRVDPEDIFLITNEENNSIYEKEEEKEIIPRRVSGRHSSAGEKRTQISVLKDSTRRSLDSFSRKKFVRKTRNKKEETTPMKHRKDGMLLEESKETRRFEHRIVVGTGGGGYRWSDVQPSDLLYLRSEMILSDHVRRLKRSRPSVLHEVGNNNNNNNNNGGLWQNVINSRSVSEMTGLSRFGNNEMVSRWLARFSEPKSQRNSSSSNV